MSAREDSRLSAKGRHGLSAREVAGCSREGNEGLSHCEKRLPIFLSPAGMSLTKLSLAGNNLIIPGLGEFGY